MNILHSLAAIVLVIAFSQCATTSSISGPRELVVQGALVSNDVGDLKTCTFHKAYFMPGRGPEADVVVKVYLVDAGRSIAVAFPDIDSKPQKVSSTEVSGSLELLDGSGAVLTTLKAIRFPNRGFACSLGFSSNIETGTFSKRIFDSAVAVRFKASADFKGCR